VNDVRVADAGGDARLTLEGGEDLGRSRHLGAEDFQGDALGRRSASLQRLAARRVLGDAEVDTRCPAALEELGNPVALREEDAEERVGRGMHRRAAVERSARRGRPPR